MLIRETILQANDLELERVNAPEWAAPGQEAEAFFYVRVMSGTCRDAFDMSFEDNVNLRARMLCMTICDAQGELLFSLEDIVLLGKKSARVLDRAFTVASRINRLGVEAVEDAKKNSETIPLINSGSNLP